MNGIRLTLYLIFIYVSMLWVGFYIGYQVGFKQGDDHGYNWTMTKVNEQFLDGASIGDVLKPWSWVTTTE